MKKLIFSSLVGLALIAFTGCTKGDEVPTSKCNGAEKSESVNKCDSAKRLKCSADNSPAKCSGSGKCAK